MHRGDALPFWQQACAEDRPQRLRPAAADRSVLLRRQRRLGVQRARPALRRGPARRRRSRSRARLLLPRLRGALPAGCVNLLDGRRRRRPIRARSTCGCCCAKAGPNLLEMPEPDLYARACRHGWTLRVREAVRRRDDARPRIDRRRLAARAGLLRVRRRRRAMAPRAVAGARRPALPAEPLPASSRFPAGPFVMGADRARDPQAFDNERWSATRGEGTVDVPTFLHRASRSHRRAVRGLRAATGWSVDGRALDGAADSSGDASCRGPTRWPTAAGSRRR